MTNRNIVITLGAEKTAMVIYLAKEHFDIYMHCASSTTKTFVNLQQKS